MDSRRQRACACSCSASQWEALAKGDVCRAPMMNRHTVQKGPPDMSAANVTRQTHSEATIQNWTVPKGMLPSPPPGVVPLW